MRWSLPGDAPPSSRAFGPPPEPTTYERSVAAMVAFVGHLGLLGRMCFGVLRVALRRPLEIRSTLYQLEALGVRSLGIASVVALFTGLVMAVQFAYGLQKFGGIEYTGRIIGLSFARELAPSLTAVVVGARIGSGITAELGSMAVTEQIDAIRALGADPLKKLVLPRLVASVVLMPILAAFALVLGFVGAMFIIAIEFGLPHGFFLQTALASVRFADYFSGMFKTPFFGAITALLGCHFGMITRGGTEGVGMSTTRSVVAISISILIADFFLTKVSMLIWPSGA
ncbi:MAG: ABC transporter permease [Deltaproteobacteria bacterium]|jgi:phospholipid/cholesterol/gamma-HCH transport system permease protein|nr:ABC transporter permease [Deltaproteobacteria bacterium]MBW2531164.1 ABC transporter permease [Deltaproteobacteria bacterium]